MITKINLDYLKQFPYIIMCHSDIADKMCETAWGRFSAPLEAYDMAVKSIKYGTRYGIFKHQMIRRRDDIEDVYEKVNIEKLLALRNI